MVYTDELRVLPLARTARIRTRAGKPFHQGLSERERAHQHHRGLLIAAKEGNQRVYHGLSTEHLQSYLDEHCFRYDNREVIGRRGMFDAFLSRIEKASPTAS
jgi:hypothetical protein